MAALYEIDAQYRDLLNEVFQQAEENQGEIPADLAAKLDAVEMVREIKIENCVKAYKNEQAIAEMISREFDALAKRVRSHENRALWLKNYLAAIVTKGQKMEFPSGRIGWRKSTAVEVVMENLLPESCFKIIPETKKVVIADVEAGIKAGTIPEEVAHMVERQHIQLK